MSRLILNPHPQTSSSCDIDNNYTERPPPFVEVRVRIVRHGYVNTVTLFLLFCNFTALGIFLMVDYYLLRNQNSI